MKPGIALWDEDRESHIGKSGEAIFHRIAAPSQTALQTLLNRVTKRLVRRLERDGLLIADPALVRSDKPAKPFTVERDGFSLNAAVACQAYQRDRLERLCR